MDISTYLCTRCMQVVPLARELDRTRETTCLGACLPGKDLSYVPATVTP